MDRLITYAGAIPLETDPLNSNKFGMLGVGFASEAAFGSSTAVAGLSISATGPASMSVIIGRGSIYAVDTNDATAYGSLGTDSNACVKQGILGAPQTLALTAPGTSGYSQNYLICASYSTVDGAATVLNYYNSSNPAVPLSGPGNSGTAQNTVRYGKCNITLVPGVAATSGSQTDPAVPAGSVPLYRVIVANGQTSITSANWITYPTTNFITPIPQLNVVRVCTDTGTANNLVITAQGVSALSYGQVFLVYKMGSANTSAMTGTVNFGATYNVIWSDGTPLAANDWPANAPAMLAWDGTALRVLSIMGPSVFDRKAASSIFGNGYQKFASGLILQWGLGTLPNSGTTSATVGVTFPIAFPTAVFSVTGAPNLSANSTYGYMPSWGATALATSGFTATGDTLTGTATPQIPFNRTVQFTWTALGY